MNKRVYSKVFHRAKDKVRNKIPLTPLEYRVWSEMQDFFLRVSLPIIQEIEEEQAKDWVNHPSLSEGA